MTDNPPAQAAAQEQHLAAATAEYDVLRLQLQDLHSAYSALQVSHTALADRLGAALAAQEAAEAAAESALAALAESEARQAVSRIVASAVQRAIIQEAGDLRQQVTAPYVSCCSGSGCVVLWYHDDIASESRRMLRRRSCRRD